MLCEYLDPCPEQQLKQLYDELDTSEVSLKNGAKYLMEWLEQQPHLPNIKDENILINFIVASKNSLENTKKNLELRFTIRALIPEIIQDRDPVSEEYRNVIKMIAYLPLPKVTPEGYRVIVFRLLKLSKQTELNINWILKAQTIFNDVLINNDRVRGIIFIMDYERTQDLVAHIMTRIRFNELISRASKLKKWNTMLIKKFYAVNLPSSLEPLFALSMRALKPKLRKKITIWTKNPTELVQEIPRNILPPIYGGDELSLEELGDQFYKYVLQFREWLTTDACLVADLAKKPPEFKFDEEIQDFGVNGSFRNLSVD